MNRVELIGRLTADPELKYTPSGMAVSNVRIAVDRPPRREEGAERATDFFTVVLWGKLAESVAQYQTKGNRIAVAGRLQMRAWERDGQRHSVVEVVGEQVDFLERRRDAAGVGAGVGDAGPGGSEGPEDDDEVPF